MNLYYSVPAPRKDILIVFLLFLLVIYCIFSYVSAGTTTASPLGVPVSPSDNPAGIVVNGAIKPVTMNTPLQLSDEGLSSSGISDKTRVLSTASTRTTTDIKRAVSSQPVTPVHVGSIVNGGSVKMNQPKDVFVSGKYAYVVSETSSALEVVDISNPASPKHVGCLEDGDGGASLSHARGIYVVGNYAYIVAKNASYSPYDTSTRDVLEIVNIADPAHPAHAGSVVDRTIWTGETREYDDGGIQISGMKDIHVVNNLVYLYGWCLLTIVDVGNPAHWVEKGDFTSLWGNSIFVKGKYAYLTEEYGIDLGIYDISDSTKPVFMSNISDGEGGAQLCNPYSVYVNDIYAFVTSGGDELCGKPYSLEIVDISKSTAPKHAGKISEGDGGALLNGPIGPNSVVVNGSYAYVACAGSDALEIIDISDPTAPTHAGSISDSTDGAELDGAYSVFICGKYAYVASKNSDALEIIDISGTNAPTITSITPPSGQLGGTLQLTIVGTGFEAKKSTVSFSGSGVKVGKYTTQNENRIVVSVTIAKTAKTGVRTLTITNPTSGKTDTGTFTIKTAPKITKISPPNGPQSWKHTITITGTGFEAKKSTVSFSGSGVKVGKYTIPNDKKIVVPLIISKTAKIGPRVVTVKNPTYGGVATGTFTVGTPPTIKSISPKSGLKGTKFPMTIIGTNFEAKKSTVSFSGSGIKVIKYTKQTDKTIVVQLTVSKTTSTGTHTVTVKNPSSGLSARKTFMIKAKGTNASQVEPVSSISNGLLSSPVLSSSSTRSSKSKTPSGSGLVPIIIPGMTQEISDF